MRETQKHIDAYNTYYMYLQEGRNKSASITQLSQDLQVNESTIYRWAKAFDWDGRSAIQNNDLINKTADKVNDALSDNKAWYLSIIHKALS